MDNCPVKGIFSLLYDIVENNSQTVVLTDLRRMAEWQRCYPDMDVNKIAMLVNVYGGECNVIDFNYLNVSTHVLETYVTDMIERTFLYKVLQSAAMTHRGENCINALIANAEEWVESKDMVGRFVDDARYPDEIIVALAQSTVFIRACACKDIDICSRITETTSGIVLSTIAGLLSTSDTAIPLAWLSNGYYRTPHAEVLFRCYRNEPGTDWSTVITPDVSVLAMEVLKERNVHTLGAVRDAIQKYREVSPRVEYMLTKLACAGKYADLKLYEIYDDLCKTYNISGEELLKHIDSAMPVTLKKYQHYWEESRRDSESDEALDTIM